MYVLPRGRELVRQARFRGKSPRWVSAAARPPHDKRFLLSSLHAILACNSSRTPDATIAC